MRYTFLLAALLLASPAWAAKTCVIVYADDVPWSKEIYWHEMAHCNGWKHPKHAEGAAFKKGYKAEQPPKKYLFKYPGPMRILDIPTDKANWLCGSYGCQWFE